MAGSDGRYFGAKVYSTNPRHKPHFVFVLYRAEDAELLAVIEANHLGQIRTGAASGYATQLLARSESRTLAVVGSGLAVTWKGWPQAYQSPQPMNAE